MPCHNNNNNSIQILAKCVIAKLSLNCRAISSQFQFKLRLRLALFPAIPATHKPMTLVSKVVRLNDFFKITSGLLQDYFNLIWGGVA